MAFPIGKFTAGREALGPTMGRSGSRLHLTEPSKSLSDLEQQDQLCKSV